MNKSHLKGIVAFITDYETYKRIEIRQIFTMFCTRRFYDPGFHTVSEKKVRVRTCLVDFHYENDRGEKMKSWKYSESQFMQLKTKAQKNKS